MNNTEKTKLDKFYKWLKELTVRTRDAWLENKEADMNDWFQAEYSAYDEALSKFVELGLSPYKNIKLDLGLKYECIETSYYGDSKDEMFTKGRIYVVTEQYRIWRGLPSNDGNVRTLSCGVLTEEYFKLIES